MRLQFMTFNIRHDHGEHASDKPFAQPPALPESLKGEQPWSLRKWKVADTVLMYSPDIVGFQEPLYHQVVDLESLLNDEYEWVGAGRNDGNENGEYCPVFYKRDVLAVEDWKTIWLSKTPEAPGSLGWDANHPRIANQVQFKRLADGVVFTVFNTHFDHEGIEARRGAASLLLERAKAIPHFCVLMGDMNSPETDPGYLTLTGSHYQDHKDSNLTWHQVEALNDKVASSFARRAGRPVCTTESNITLPTHRVLRPGQILHHLRADQQQQEDTFVDCRYELETRLTHDNARAPLSGPYGDQDTFTSFGEGDPDAVKAPRRLDYIMMMRARENKATVKRFGVLSNLFDDGLYISDHRPVVAVIDW